MKPDDGPIAGVLGAAHYYNGDPEAAARALEKGLSLLAPEPTRDHCWQWFLLGMAKARLGDADAGSALYERAVTWMAKNEPDDEGLARVRGEASKLLGKGD